MSGDDGLFSMGAAPEMLEAAVAVEAKRAIHRVRDSYVESFSKATAALRQGGSLQEMRDLANAARLFDEIVRELGRAVELVDAAKTSPVAETTDHQNRSTT